MLGRLARIEWVAGLGPVMPKGRRLTLMFTDIEGFTAYAARRGDRAAVRLLRRHDDVVLPAIKRHRGRVLKRLGDGLMVAFPEPGAALKAAVEMLRRVGRRDGLSLRIGIHTGRALARRGDLIGHDVNVASRIADRARGGQILLSADALEPIERADGTKIRAAGALRIGGTESVRLFEARPERRRPSRSRSAARGPARPKARGTGRRTTARTRTTAGKRG